MEAVRNIRIAAAREKNIFNKFISTFFLKSFTLYALVTKPGIPAFVHKGIVRIFVLPEILYA